MTVPLRQTTDPGEFALRIVKGFEGRITAVETSVDELEAKIEKVIRAEGRKSTKRLTWIGTLGVALIGGITQWQVAKVQASSAEKASVIAERTVGNSDRNIERIIEETSRKSAKAAVEERDRQVDQIAAKR